MSSASANAMAMSAAEAGLLSGYQPTPGSADELIGADRRIRPVWQPFIDMLEGQTANELAARISRADQYIKDAGVYYRVYEQSRAGEREWPLAEMPVLIDEAEWDHISAGLVQRADLLERIAADIYGPQQLVRDGLLPPELVASSPEFMLPMVGVRPRDGHFLHFCAFELGRGPDGRWWVLGDRTQAPSGIGFALENRVATVRAFPELPPGMYVHRLAGFFRQFRDAVLALADHPSGAAILTPGPNSETYYEHAWIARYLGILLLEGEDLTTRDGRLMVRTVSGLQPVSVLWRRLDAGFLDPLELRPDSRIGTPGLVGALRNRSVSMINSPGTGVLETRALLAFLPRICRALNQCKLQLPSIATWWCGQPAERKHVVAHLDEMMLGPSMSTRLPYEDAQSTLLGSNLDPDDRRQLLSLLEERGPQWVAQEAVTLSTTPTFVEGRLEPRPMVLRAFAARTPEGWKVMPGGFARIGGHTDTAAISMNQGGQAADVWVVSRKPVVIDSLFDAGHVERRRQAAAVPLPSRAAENLLWLGRYTERSEAIARILRAYHVRVAENQGTPPPLLEMLSEILEQWGLDIDQPIPDRLLSCIEGATASAGRIRDRFSPDGWAALYDLSKTARRFSERVSAGDDAGRAVTVLLRKLAGFSGLLHENMYRSTGWRFLEIGRRIERGIQIAELVSLLGREDAPDALQPMLLEIGDSVMTHRSRYGVNAGPLSVIDLMVLDPLNPRSVQFQIEALKVEFAHLPPSGRPGGLPGFAKAALRLHTDLSIRDAGELSSADLTRLAGDIADLYLQISQAYFA